MSGADDGPLVSVIVPAWNAEATLLETLESVRAQTYRNIEIIIVNDGSTDGTPEVARRYCGTDARARLVSQENRGLSEARNRGIAESSGEWIAPIDADDLWHSTKIEKQVQAALAAPVPPGFVYCWYHSIDEQGFVRGSVAHWAFEGAALKRFAYQNTIHTLLLSRAAARAVGGYDRSLRACEDAMIHLRIARRYPVAVVTEFLVGYRRRANSMSRDTNLVIDSWRTVHRRLVSEGADIPPQVLRWTEGFFNMILAEELAVAGSYLKSLRKLLGAFRHDPVKSSAFLSYRLIRTAMRIARGRRPKPERVHFQDADPRTFVQADADELPRLAALLRRIDERRLRRLGRAEKLENHG